MIFEVHVHIYAPHPPQIFGGTYCVYYLIKHKIVYYLKSYKNAKLQQGNTF